MAEKKASSKTKIVSDANAKIANISSPISPSLTPPPPPPPLTNVKASKSLNIPIASQTLGKSKSDPIREKADPKPSLPEKQDLAPILNKSVRPSISNAKKKNPVDKPLANKSGTNMTRLPDNTLDKNDKSTIDENALIEGINVGNTNLRGKNKVAKSSLDVNDNNNNNNNNNNDFDDKAIKQAIDPAINDSSISPKNYKRQSKAASSNRASVGYDDNNNSDDESIINGVIKEGTLCKRGDSTKSWKYRYFIVWDSFQNYRIDYYSHKGGKLKGSICPYGYISQMSSSPDDDKEFGGSEEFGIKLVPIFMLNSNLTSVGSIDSVKNTDSDQILTDSDKVTAAKVSEKKSKETSKHSLARVWLFKCQSPTERQDWLAVFNRACAKAIPSNSAVIDKSSMLKNLLVGGKSLMLKAYNAGVRVTSLRYKTENSNDSEPLDNEIKFDDLTIDASAQLPASAHNELVDKAGSAEINVEFNATMGDIATNESSNKRIEPIRKKSVFNNLSMDKVQNAVKPDLLIKEIIQTEVELKAAIPTLEINNNFKIESIESSYYFKNKEYPCKNEDISKFSAFSSPLSLLSAHRFAFNPPPYQSLPLSLILSFSPSASVIVSKIMKMKYTNQFIASLAKRGSHMNRLKLLFAPFKNQEIMIALEDSFLVFSVAVSTYTNNDNNNDDDYNMKKNAFNRGLVEKTKSLDGKYQFYFVRLPIEACICAEEDVNSTVTFRLLIDDKYIKSESNRNESFSYYLFFSALSPTSPKEWLQALAQRRMPFSQHYYRPEYIRPHLPSESSAPTAGNTRDKIG